MKTIITIILSLFVIQSAGLSAQVTIGSGIPPVKAALLDIKTQEADNENITSDSGGIVLPRVKLTNVNTLEPFIKTTDPEWSIANQDKTKKIHTGLMVYNLNTSSGGFKEGVYIWDGTAWRIGAGSNAWELKGNNGTDPNDDYIGTKDAKGLSIRTNNTERIRITDNGKVGIGTANPVSNLDINGSALVTGTTTLIDSVTIGSTLGGTLTAKNKVFLKTVDIAPPFSVSPLAINNSTGEVYAIRGTSQNSKSFSYIKYTLTTGNKDWISNFNTMIPTDAYTVVVVGSSFKTKTKDDGLKFDNTGPNANSTATYSGQSVYAFEEGNTWRLTADYIGGSTADGLNGTWDIYCLIINKSIINILPSQSVTFSSGTTGSGTKPNEL
ncbi:MAG: hypothetical protein LBT43_02935 [Prevotella sp.]|jgi:hypothetical protein|nr:hypothetical protein [Prevotella sp.]MDR2001489.1 hypothetical protein [Prevotella sp.]